MDNSEIKILVLDAEQRSALAVIRSLGRQGYTVAAASDQEQNIGSSSRYCNISFRCPSPRTSPEFFLKWLSIICEDWAPNVIIPVSDISAYYCAKIKSELPASAVVSVVEPDKLEFVQDKFQLIQIAEQLGVDVPATINLDCSERDRPLEDSVPNEIPANFPFPAVLKPRISQVFIQGESVQAPVRYVDSAEEALDELLELRAVIGPLPPYLLQQRIVGVGVGYFALCARGEALVEFAHTRILEKPPSGGRSVLSQSISLDSAPREQAKKLFQYFGWDGVAMAEFKCDHAGRFYLMEINPRFWGSLQLAVDSGVDFPAMLTELCLTQKLNLAELKQRYAEVSNNYKVGQRLRWVLGTLDHVLIRLKAEPLLALRDILLKNSLEIFKSRSTRSELWRWDDPPPAWTELKQYFFGQ